MAKQVITIMQMNGMALGYFPSPKIANAIEVADSLGVSEILMTELRLNGGLITKLPREFLQDGQLECFQIIPREAIAVVQIALVAEIPLASPTDVRKLSLQS